VCLFVGSGSTAGTSAGVTTITPQQVKLVPMGDP
jgi:membrane-bound lytic murein transglycosylase